VNIACSEGPILPILHHDKLEAKLGLKCLPDMLFTDSSFSLSLGSHDPNLAVTAPNIDKDKNPEFSIKFTCEDALKAIEVDNYKHLQVKSAKDWQSTRDIESAPIKDKGNWTFSTTYRGTFESNSNLSFQPTLLKIDYDRLKDQTKKIAFNEDIVLFEDEADDNGQMQLRLRFRVMQDCFFILLRNYIRIDGVIIRLIETRIYHESGTKHLVRENSYREIDWEKCSKHHLASNARLQSQSVLYSPDILNFHLMSDDDFCKSVVIRDDKEIESLSW